MKLFLEKSSKYLYILGLLSGSVVKILPANARDEGGVNLILGSEDPLGTGPATHPIFLPGKSHGQRSLTDHTRLKELDTTKHMPTLIHTHARAPPYPQKLKQISEGLKEKLTHILLKKCCFNTF